MLDHIGLRVTDFARSKDFFAASLAPLAITVMMEFPDGGTGGASHAGFGDERPFFWIGDARPVSGPVHVAFSARSRADVTAFHAAALAAGGTDNGAPGLRPDYHPNYFGAFVLDPDGNNIEAVCHLPS
jgi:catechol 2,3-dioxygenase-like lactoylglutathione lyase family enzyme